MFKRIVIAVAFTLALAPTACFADDIDGMAATGDQAALHDTPSTPANLTTENPWSDISSNNGDGQAREGGYGDKNATPIGQLDLPGEGSTGMPDGGVGAGASTGAPLLGSFIAPGNLALQNQKLRRLPETRLDSFVKSSGYNDFIYGDEGTDGPPPYSNFGYIEQGIWSSGLTTGHKSDAPSAWGYPQ